MDRQARYLGVTRQALISTFFDQEREHLAKDPPAPDRVRLARRRGNGTGGSGLMKQIDVAAFLRVYQMRAANIMWFLGAGSSRLAGIKTASDMIWDFKQEIYRSNKKLPPSSIADTGDPVVRQKIQSYFDELGTFPPSAASDEYAKYFEATYPHAKDRRTYLDRLISIGKPTFGHHALALLMREGLCRMVWTTNFGPYGRGRRSPDSRRHWSPDCRRPRRAG